MAKVVKKKLSIDLKLVAIELLRQVINFPASKEISLESFKFNIDVENRVDIEKKMFFVVVTVDVKGDDESRVFGSVMVSNVFNIANFDDVIDVNNASNGILQVPEALTNMLISNAISTTRGVMFSTFKGTFLHNALLPIVDFLNVPKVEKTSLTTG